MRTARPLGLSADGSSLLVLTDDGETIAIVADGRLRAAMRQDRPRLGQLEIEMDSALRPREIQARIRAGESVEDVARAAGVPVEKIDVYAGPVLAERGHISAIAQTSSVRRRGEAGGHRNLRTVVHERLIARGVDIESVAWDAWRNEDRRWTLQAAYPSGRTQHEALFTFDMAGRFSVAANDEARWLLGELSTAHGPQPGRRRPSEDPDNEPTIDLDDEFALVRAVQGEPVEAEPDGQDAERPVTDAAADSSSDKEDERDEGDEERGDHSSASAQERSPQDTDRQPAPGSSSTPPDDVYDVLPAPESELDVLYEMLGGFNEDSVNIYAGLSEPVTEDAAPRQTEPQPPEPEQSEPEQSEAQEPEPEQSENQSTEPQQSEAQEPEPQPTEPAAEPTSTRRRRRRGRGRAQQEEQPSESVPATPEAAPATPDEAGPLEAAEVPTPASATEPATPEPGTPEPATPEPASPEPATPEPANAEPAGEDIREPEQPSLIEGDEPASPGNTPDADQDQPKPRPRSRRKRAEVPSWDEIMFGSPKQR